MSNTGNEKRTVSSRAKFLRIMPLVAVALIDVLFLAMLDSIFYSEKRELIPESKKVGENMGELLEPIDSIATAPPTDATAPYGVGRSLGMGKNPNSRRYRAGVVAVTSRDCRARTSRRSVGTSRGRTGVDRHPGDRTQHPSRAQR